MAVEIARARAARVSQHAREWLLFAFAVWGVLEQLLGEHRVSVMVGLALLVPVLVPLLLYRRHPLGSAVLLGAYAPLRAALGGAAYPDVTPLQICVVVVWTQGRYTRDLRMGTAGAAIAAGGVLASMRVAEAGHPAGVSTMVLGAFFFACVMAAGALARRHSEEARAELTARHALELERERHVREALVTERLRIARELHDLVAHGVAAISVQAGVAEQWLDRNPARAQTALRNARRRARTVLAEMRRLLSVLRDDDVVSSKAAGADDTVASSMNAVPSSAFSGDWPSVVSDAAPALAVVAFGAVEVASVHSSVTSVARLLGVAAFGIVVLARRAAPLPCATAFAVVLILRAADGQLAHASRSATVSLSILGWSLGTGTAGQKSRLAALALLEVGVALALAVAERHPVPSDFVVLGLLPLAACGAGSAVRRWRVAAQIERARIKELAVGRDADRQRAVRRERASVARELHDVVAHAVSIISVQAGAAESLVGRDTDRARQSIGAVLAAAHQALVELRHLLDLLSIADSTRADYDPQPGLGSLAELMANACETGLDVQLIQQLSDRDPPAGVQLTAFRIVQEALTNARKHAAPGVVVVKLTERPGELEVEISSAMTRTNGGGECIGHGLVGMRERARLYGGHLDAGPDGHGRWLVRAVLPTEAELAA